jgi:Tol biopolymer transport system component
MPRSRLPLPSRPSPLAAIVLALLLAASAPALAGEAAPPAAAPAASAPEILVELKSCPHKIVYETNRDGNWELYVMNADGSSPANLTRTPDVDEMYVKASPDGSRIAFVADEGKGDAKVRNLYWMRRDGSGRTLVAGNAREPCWSADGMAIAYLPGEMPAFTYTDFATKGLAIHDLKSGKTRQHPNAAIHHLYTLNWSPDGKWFVATVHGGMGYSHAILALEAEGNGVFDLHLGGCRPDLTADGKRIAWGHGDFAVGVADLDLSASPPKASGTRNAVQSADPLETYHADWSPDGKYLCYTFGPKKKGKDLKGLIPELPGVTAPGWNIRVAAGDGVNRWVALTSDGMSCKEPDWLPAPKEGGAK